MEEEVILYAGRFHPVTVATKAWMTVAQVSNFKEVKSDYNYSGVGELPLLRYQHYLFVQNNIINFLKCAYDLDTDLSEEEKRNGVLIEELCQSRLHPASLQSMWMEPGTSKDFYTTPGNWVSKFLTFPAQKAFFEFEKIKLSHYLKHQHNISTQKDAFLQAESSHKLLSEILGEKPFFHSKENRAEYPRSTDIIVYSYLVEELKNLPDHPHVVYSLKQHPNLVSFVQRMESVLAKLTRVVQLNHSLDLVSPSQSCSEEYFPPKLHMSAGAKTTWEPYRYRSGAKLSPPPEETPSHIKTYISSVAGVLFLFLFLR